MIVALLLLHDGQAAGQLAAALRRRARVRVAATGDELRDELARTARAVVVLEAADAEGRPTAPLVAQLRSWYPATPIIAYCDPRVTPSGAILDLARAGVHELVLRGVDDLPTTLHAAIASAQRGCAADQLMQRVGDRLPRAVAEIVPRFMAHADRPLSVSDAAAALGVHRKTLLNRLATAGCPPPSAIAGWCRLLLAANQLDDPGRFADHVAVELDFPSGSALRNMFRRYVGMSPSELRAAGGFAYLCERFADACAAGPAAVPATTTRRRASVAYLPAIAGAKIA